MLAALTASARGPGSPWQPWADRIHYVDCINCIDCDSLLNVHRFGKLNKFYRMVLSIMAQHAEQTDEIEWPSRRSDVPGGSRARMAVRVGGAGLRLSFYFVSFVCVVDIFDELHKFVYILVLKFELLSSRAL